MKILKANSPAMFDRIAKRYDLANRVLSCAIDVYWRRQLVKETPKVHPFKLLDIASGTGAQIKNLLKRRKNISSATGIDLSSQMLLIAQKKIPATFILADAKNLPFPDNSFNIATLCFGIRNMDDPVCALKEMQRVLELEGKALILEFSLPCNFLKKPYLFYLNKILPVVGGYLAKDKSAYIYLSETIQSFPYGDDFLKWMKEAGFSKAVAKPLTFGIATLYIGIK
jgi:demethylmenaquinone methyltransferase/2-methoxy-6-polyprenyl-1,4-benzoquinol methylase